VRCVWGPCGVALASSTSSGGGGEAAQRIDQQQQKQGDSKGLLALMLWRLLQLLQLVSCLCYLLRRSNPIHLGRAFGIQRPGGCHIAERQWQSALAPAPDPGWMCCCLLLVLCILPPPLLLPTQIGNRLGQIGYNGQRAGAAAKRQAKPTQRRQQKKPKREARQKKY
jgi:hypothetical protein